MRRLERLRLLKNAREQEAGGAEAGHHVYKHVYVIDLKGLGLGMLGGGKRKIISSSLGKVCAHAPPPPSPPC
jgi:hypothetical protein